MNARGPNKRKPVMETAGHHPAASAGEDVLYSRNVSVATTPPKRWYTTREAAEYLECGKSTLEKYRSQGTGPAYHQSATGDRSVIHYDRADLDAWHAAYMPRVETAHSAQIDRSTEADHG